MMNLINFKKDIIYLTIITFFVASFVIYYNNSKKDKKILEAEIELKNKDVRTLEFSNDALKDGIESQNRKINDMKIQLEHKEVIFKEKVKYITKTIEVQKEVVKYLKGEEDCNKSKEILDEIIFR